MSDTTLEIAATGTDRWVYINTFTDGDQAYDEAQRIFRASAGTLDVRLLDAGDDIPSLSLANTVAR